MRNKYLITLLFTLGLSPSYAESAWIAPTIESCKANGGEIKKNNLCQAKWEDAMKICKVSNATLPSIDKLKNLVTACGATNVTGTTKDWRTVAGKNNKNNKYHTCHKKNGFEAYNYWSSTLPVNNEGFAFEINFEYGYQTSTRKNTSFLVKCVSK
jgi:hypothetical protein